MKKKIFLVCATLIVLAAAVVGVKAYNYYSMSPLMRANIEALSNPEYPVKVKGYEMKRVLKEIKLPYNASVGMNLNGTTITLADIKAGVYLAFISCCVSTNDKEKECPFAYQNKDC